MTPYDLECFLKRHDHSVTMGRHLDGNYYCSTYYSTPHGKEAAVGESKTLPGALENMMDELRGYETRKAKEPKVSVTLNGQPITGFAGATISYDPNAAKKARAVHVGNSRGNAYLSGDVIIDYSGNYFELDANGQWVSLP